MNKDLRKIIDGNDNHAIHTIQAASYSPQFANIVWVIVEAIDDIPIYSPYFDNSKVRLHTSRISSCSCDNVEKIVGYFETTDIPVIGIRDADYTPFSSAYHLPRNVFRTDFRDIEMTMLHSVEVRRDLKKDCGNDLFDSIYAAAILVASCEGILRIYNDLRQLGFSFKTKIKKKDYIDEANMALCPNFLEKMIQVFTTECGIGNEDLETFYAAHCNDDPYTLCQGHSFISYLLSMKLFKKSTSDFRDAIISSYHKSGDFTTSNLFDSIGKWETARQLKILN